jgi:hypothetical protein
VWALVIPKSTPTSRLSVVISFQKGLTCIGPMATLSNIRNGWQDAGGSRQPPWADRQSAGVRPSRFSGARRKAIEQSASRGTD